MENEKNNQNLNNNSLNLQSQNTNDDSSNNEEHDDSLNNEEHDESSRQMILDAGNATSTINENLQHQVKHALIKTPVRVLPAVSEGYTVSVRGQNNELHSIKLSSTTPLYQIACIKPITDSMSSSSTPTIKLKPITDLMIPSSTPTTTVERTATNTSTSFALNFPNLTYRNPDAQLSAVKPILVRSRPIISSYQSDQVSIGQVNVPAVTSTVAKLIPKFVFTTDQAPIGQYDASTKTISVAKLTEELPFATLPKQHATTRPSVYVVQNNQASIGQGPTIASSVAKLPPKFAIASSPMQYAMTRPSVSAIHCDQALFDQVNVPASISSVGKLPAKFAIAASPMKYAITRPNISAVHCAPASIGQANAPTTASSFTPHLKINMQGREPAQDDQTRTGPIDLFTKPKPVANLTQGLTLGAPLTQNRTAVPIEQTSIGQNQTIDSPVIQLKPMTKLYIAPHKDGTPRFDGLFRKCNYKTSSSTGTCYFARFPPTTTTPIQQLTLGRTVYATQSDEASPFQDNVSTAPSVAKSTARFTIANSPIQYATPRPIAYPVQINRTLISQSEASTTTLSKSMITTSSIQHATMPTAGPTASSVQINQELIGQGDASTITLPKSMITTSSIQHATMPTAISSRSNKIVYVNRKTNIITIPKKNIGSMPEVKKSISIDNIVPAVDQIPATNTVPNTNPVTSTVTSLSCSSEHVDHASTSTVNDSPKIESIPTFFIPKNIGSVPTSSFTNFEKPINLVLPKRTKNTSNLCKPRWGAPADDNIEPIHKYIVPKAVDSIPLPPRMKAKSCRTPKSAIIAMPSYDNEKSKDHDSAIPSSSSSSAKSQLKTKEYDAKQKRILEINNKLVQRVITQKPSELIESEQSQSTATITSTEETVVTSTNSNDEAQKFETTQVNSTIEQKEVPRPAPTESDVKKADEKPERSGVKRRKTKHSKINDEKEQFFTIDESGELHEEKMEVDNQQNELKTSGDEEQNVEKYENDNGTKNNKRKRSKKSKKGEQSVEIIEKTDKIEDENVTDETSGKRKRPTSSDSEEKSPKIIKIEESEEIDLSNDKSDQPTNDKHIKKDFEDDEGFKGFDSKVEPWLVYFKNKESQQIKTESMKVSLNTNDKKPKICKICGTKNCNNIKCMSKNEGTNSKNKSNVQNKMTFNWKSYLKNIKSRSAPITLFKNPFPAFENYFKAGMKLEAIDPEHNSLFCVSTISMIQGFRMKLHLDGYASKYDFWVDIDSRNIFPPGWCKRTNRFLLGPQKILNGSFNWNSYLKQTKSVGAPDACFQHLSQKEHDSSNLFEIGMKIEAVDLKNARQLCVATIADKIQDRILIHFDGWAINYDYWTTYDSPYMFPINWHKEQNKKLITPPEVDKFDWDCYLKDTQSIAFPANLFSRRPPIKFQRGMRIEIVDKKCPNIIRPASIIDKKDYQIKILYENWPENYAYWLNDDDPNIHPVGWCEKTNHDLELPPGFGASTKTSCPISICRGIGNIKNKQCEKHYKEEACPYSLKAWSEENEIDNRFDEGFYTLLEEHLSLRLKKIIMQAAVASSQQDQNENEIKTLKKETKAQIENLSKPSTSKVVEQTLPSTIMDDTSPSTNNQAVTNDTSLSISKAKTNKGDSTKNFNALEKLKMSDKDLLNKPASTWNHEECARAIKIVTNSSVTSNKFIDNQINGALMLLIGENDLDSMHIPPGIKVKILKLICQLTNNPYDDVRKSQRRHM